MWAANNGPDNPPVIEMLLKETTFGFKVGSNVTLNEALAQDEMKAGGKCCWGFAV
jgi:hypothetical protein